MKTDEELQIAKFKLPIIEVKLNENKEEIERLSAQLEQHATDKLAKTANYELWLYEFGHSKYDRMQSRTASYISERTGSATHCTNVKRVLLASWRERHKLLKLRGELQRLCLVADKREARIQIENLE